MSIKTENCIKCCKTVKTEDKVFIDSFLKLKVQVIVSL